MSDKMMPIQKSRLLYGDKAEVPEAVYMAAYEVYSHVFAPQLAMIEGGCRGGWGMGEFVAFLYARSFPKDQWRGKVDEALRGMKL